MLHLFWPKKAQVYPALFVRLELEVLEDRLTPAASSLVVTQTELPYIGSFIAGTTQPRIMELRFHVTGTEAVVVDYLAVDDLANKPATEPIDHLNVRMAGSTVVFAQMYASAYFNQTRFSAGGSLFQVSPGNDVIVDVDAVIKALTQGGDSGKHVLPNVSYLSVDPAVVAHILNGPPLAQNDGSIADGSHTVYIGTQPGRGPNQPLTGNSAQIVANRLASVSSYATIAVLPGTHAYQTVTVTAAKNVNGASGAFIHVDQLIFSLDDGKTVFDADNVTVTVGKTTIRAVVMDEDGNEIHGRVKAVKLTAFVDLTDIAAANVAAGSCKTFVLSLTSFSWAIPCPPSQPVVQVIWSDAYGSQNFLTETAKRSWLFWWKLLAIRR